MRILIRTCPQRSRFLPYLKNHLPSAEIIMDDGGGAMQCFYQALKAAGDDAVIHMEDDVILTANFEAKAQEVIDCFKTMPIQFFSMRKADLVIGSRVEKGSKFLMGQCFYLPQGVSREILKFAPTWKKHGTHPTGLDTLVADFFAANKMSYCLHVPSLVDHRDCVSEINSRRSTKRQSLTFVDPIDD